MLTMLLWIDASIREDDPLQTLNNRIHIFHLNVGEQDDRHLVIQVAAHVNSEALYASRMSYPAVTINIAELPTETITASRAVLSNCGSLHELFVLRVEQQAIVNILPSGWAYLQVGIYNH
jgi:hypothetical protein